MTGVYNMVCFILNNVTYHVYDKIMGHPIRDYLLIFVILRVEVLVCYRRLFPSDNGKMMLEMKFL